MPRKSHKDRKQAAAIAALVTSNGRSYKGVLAQHRVSKATFRLRQKEPRFVQALEEEIALSNRRTAALVADLLPCAIARLHELMFSDKEETGRRACMGILALQKAFSGGAPAFEQRLRARLFCM